MPVFRIFLLIYILLSSYPALSQATTQKTTIIQKIDIHSTSDQESIQFAFSGAFTETISPHFETGLVRIALPATSFNPKLEILHINNRFLRNLRLSQEANSTIVEIQFSDSDFVAIGKVSFQLFEKQLIINIDKKLTTNNSIVESSTLFAEMQEEKKAQPLALENELLKDSEITVNIIKMLIAVAIVLLFFFGILWICNRFFVSRYSIKKGKHTIKLVSSYHISPKQKIVILNVDNYFFACGVTPTSINLISEIIDNSFEKFLSQLKTSHKTGIDFSLLRTQYLETRNMKSNSNEQKTKSSFANELLTKVKKLKPID